VAHESLESREPWWVAALKRRNTDCKREAGRGSKHEPKRTDYLFAIVANLVLFWAVSSLLEWDLGFVTGSFIVVLPILQASILAQIAAHFLFLFYDARWFVHLAKVALNLLSLFAAYLLYSVYPFAFGSWDEAAHLALVLVMVAITIAVVIESVQLLFELGRLLLTPD